jgi:hypothetical protein
LIRHSRKTTCLVADLITGIHGNNPVKLYGELCQVAEDVIRDFEAEGRPLPPSRVRPMREVG